MEAAQIKIRSFALVLLFLLMSILVVTKANAALPEICGPLDTACPIPKNLLLSCGSLNGLDLYQDPDKTIHGNFFASASCGDNGVQAVLRCTGPASSPACTANDLQDCHGSNPAAASAIKVRVSIHSGSAQAEVRGLELIAGQLNPANPATPMSLSCLTRKQTVQKKVLPRVCGKSVGAVQTLVTHYTPGFQFFLIEGEFNGGQISCRGQMFSAGSGRSDFLLEKTVTCPFDYAGVYANDRLDLGCTNNACTNNTYSCVDQ